MRCKDIPRFHDSGKGGKMRTQQRTDHWSLLILVSLLLVGCASPTEGQTRTPTSQEMASETISVQDLDISSGQTIFVPAYSEVYIESNGRTIDLAVTLSVHNTDFENSIIISSVRYYSNFVNIT